MAFARNDIRTILKGAGVENVSGSLLDEICELHKEDKEQALNAANSELEKVNEELTAAKEAAGKEPDTTELDALKAEFEQYKAAVEAEKAKTVIEDAKTKALREAGFGDSVVKLLAKDDAFANVALDDSGAVSGLEDAIKSVKEVHGGLIVKAEPKEGFKPTETAPAKNSGSITSEQFGKMGYAQRVAFKNSNPEQYNSFIEGD